MGCCCFVVLLGFFRPLLVLVYLGQLLGPLLFIYVSLPAHSEAVYGYLPLSPFPSSSSSFFPPFFSYFPSFFFSNCGLRHLFSCFSLSTYFSFLHFSFCLTSSSVIFFFSLILFIFPHFSLLLDYFIHYFLFLLSAQFFSSRIHLSLLISSLHLPRSSSSSNCFFHLFSPYVRFFLLLTSRSSFRHLF